MIYEKTTRTIMGSTKKFILRYYHQILCPRYAMVTLVTSNPAPKEMPWFNEPATALRRRYALISSGHRMRYRVHYFSAAHDAAVGVQSLWTADPSQRQLDSSWTVPWSYTTTVAVGVDFLADAWGIHPDCLVDALALTRPFPFSRKLLRSLNSKCPKQGASLQRNE